MCAMCNIYRASTALTHTHTHTHSEAHILDSCTFKNFARTENFEIYWTETKQIVMLISSLQLPSAFCNKNRVYATTSNTILNSPVADFIWFYSGARAVGRTLDPVHFFFLFPLFSVQSNYRRYTIWFCRSKLFRLLLLLVVVREIARQSVRLQKRTELRNKNNERGGRKQTCKKIRVAVANT